MIGPGRFANGVVNYTDHFGNDHLKNTRIVVPVRFGQSVLASAVVDTGALWCILNPEDAEQILAQNKEWVGSDRLVVRGSLYDGGLFRVPVMLYADEGDTLTIDATVFVPVLKPGEEWRHPNFLGLDGFLHRLRFAVDPVENAFYFGAIED